MNKNSISSVFPLTDSNIDELIEGGEWECKEIEEDMHSYAIQDAPKLVGIVEVPRIVYSNLYCLSREGWKWFLPRGLKFYLETLDDEESLALESFVLCLSNTETIEKLSWLTLQQASLLVEFLNMLEEGNWISNSYEGELSEATENLSKIVHNKAGQ